MPVGGEPHIVLQSNVWPIDFVFQYSSVMFICLFFVVLKSLIPIAIVFYVYVLLFFLHMYRFYVVQKHVIQNIQLFTEAI